MPGQGPGRAGRERANQCWIATSSAPRSPAVPGCTRRRRLCARRTRTELGSCPMMLSKRWNGSPPGARRASISRRRVRAADAREKRQCHVGAISWKAGRRGCRRKSPVLHAPVTTNRRAGGPPAAPKVATAAHPGDEERMQVAAARRPTRPSGIQRRSRRWCRAPAPDSSSGLRRYPWRPRSGSRRRNRCSAPAASETPAVLQTERAVLGAMVRRRVLDLEELLRLARRRLSAAGRKVGIVGRRACAHEFAAVA